MNYHNPMGVGMHMIMNKTSKEFMPDIERIIKLGGSEMHTLYLDGPNKENVIRGKRKTDENRTYVIDSYPSFVKSWNPSEQNDLVERRIYNSVRDLFFNKNSGKG